MKKINEATFYGRLWKTGKNSDVITVKKDILGLMGLERGEMVEIVLKKIEKETDRNVKKDGNEPIFRPKE